MPKYKMGEKVWFIEDNLCQEGEVSGIQKVVSYFGPETEWAYSTAKPEVSSSINRLTRISHKYMLETNIFASKEELIASL